MKKVKQIYLYFKEINLGFLSQENDVFVWFPNLRNIELFEKQNPAFEDFLLLERKEPVVYTKIPFHYSDFISACSRADLVKKAGINTQDSEFEKLYKLAKLDFSNQDFYIKA